MELKGKKINFLGDSITEGVGASCPENVYWQVFGRHTGAIVRGYGVSGSRMAPQPGVTGDACVGGEEYYGLRAARMDPDADVVVVFGGTNDFGHGNAPMGTMDSRDDTTFYGAMHALCRQLMEKYPLGEIVIMTPLHRTSEEVIINEMGVRTPGPLSAYVQAIRDVAEYYGLPLLDLYAMSGIQPRVEANRVALLPDGLHPSDAGHARVAQRLEGFLRSL